MLANSFDPHDPADIVRLVVSALGVFLAGSNLAFVIHARRLFPTPTIPFWRLFFTAKTLVIGLFASVIYLRDTGDLGWRTVGAGVGFTLTLYALGMIWHKRPYKFIRVRPELLGPEERAEIARSMDEHPYNGTEQP